MSQLTFFEENPDELITWEGSRQAGLDRLNHFVPRAGRAYASERNYDFGPHKRFNISCLSPWIRHRLVLEEEVVREALSVHSRQKAEKFIQEVFWRTYFKGWLEQRPAVWSEYRNHTKTLFKELDVSADLRMRYDNATKGKTGIDCFDSWAHELMEVGYLHNHARMWFASIWIFTLRLPWQLGADFIYRHLLDGDPASNTLSWRWVAGLHTKGKHYVARKSNIEKYTNGRFSPDGLAIDPLPLTETIEYSVQPIADVHEVPEGPFALIITEEDCNPETLALPQEPVGCCSMLATNDRSPLHTGAPAQAFAADAVKSALIRASDLFQREPTICEDDDWAKFLTEWARALGVSTLITAYIPIGPVREKLDQSLPALNQAGISLIEIQRAYDLTNWPHTTRGFFKLKQKIPEMIKKLNLE